MPRIIWLAQPGMEPFASGQQHAMQLALQEAGYEVFTQYYQPRLSSWRSDRCDWLIWSFLPTQLDVWAAKLYASQQMIAVHELNGHQHEYPSVDNWCVPSESLSLQLRHAGVPADRISVATGYCPKISLLPLDLRQELGVDSSTMLIYSGGPLTAATGNRLAIWALLLLQQIEAPVRLILHGIGPEQERLEQWMQGLTSQDAVYFAPASASVHDLVGQSDIVWLPRMCDGVVDALWAGLSHRKPMMVSNQPSHAELIHHGETGMIMGDNHPPEWASLISRMLTDRSIMTKLGQATRTLPPQRMPLPSVFLPQQVFHRMAA